MYCQEIDTRLKRIESSTFSFVVNLFICPQTFCKSQLNKINFLEAHDHGGREICWHWSPSAFLGLPLCISAALTAPEVSCAYHRFHQASHEEVWAPQASLSSCRRVVASSDPGSFPSQAYIPGLEYNMQDNPPEPMDPLTTDECLQRWRAILHACNIPATSSRGRSLASCFNTPTIFCSWQDLDYCTEKVLKYFFYTSASFFQTSYLIAPSELSGSPLFWLLLRH